MVGREYLEQIAQILLQHKIVQQITEEMMHDASNNLRAHASNSSLQRWASSACLLEALVMFLRETPLRFVWLDAEMDSSTYAELVRSFADATGGEWVPEQVTDDIDRHEGTDPYRITVDFDVRGEPIHGEWTTSSLKWAEVGFLDLMENIAEMYLSGDFVDIPTHDQTIIYAYLPRPVVLDLQDLLDQLEQEYPDFATLAQTFSGQE